MKKCLSIVLSLVMVMQLFMSFSVSAAAEVLGIERYKDEIVITYSEGTSETPEVYALGGVKQELSQKNENGKVTIDISSLADGNYYVSTLNQSYYFAVKNLSFGVGETTTDSQTGVTQASGWKTKRAPSVWDNQKAYMLDDWLFMCWKNNTKAYTTYTSENGTTYLSDYNQGSCALLRSDDYENAKGYENAELEFDYKTMNYETPVNDAATAFKNSGMRVYFNSGDMYTPGTNVNDDWTQGKIWADKGAYMFALAKASDGKLHSVLHKWNGEVSSFAPQNNLSGTCIVEDTVVADTFEANKPLRFKIKTDRTSTGSVKITVFAAQYQENTLGEYSKVMEYEDSDSPYTSGVFYFASPAQGMKDGKPNSEFGISSNFIRNVTYSETGVPAKEDFSLENISKSGDSITAVFSSNIRGDLGDIFSIYDANGYKKTLSATSNGKQAVIDISSYADGDYYMIVKAGEEAKYKISKVALNAQAVNTDGQTNSWTSLKQTQYGNKVNAYMLDDWIFMAYNSAGMYYYTADGTATGDKTPAALWSKCAAPLVYYNSYLNYKGTADSSLEFDFKSMDYHNSQGGNGFGRTGLNAYIRAGEITADNGKLTADQGAYILTVNYQGGGTSTKNIETALYKWDGTAADACNGNIPGTNVAAKVTAFSGMAPNTPVRFKADAVNNADGSVTVNVYGAKYENGVLSDYALIMTYTDSDSPVLKGSFAFSAVTQDSSGSFTEIDGKYYNKTGGYYGNSSNFIRNVKFTAGGLSEYTGEVVIAEESVKYENGKIVVTLEETPQSADVIKLIDSNKRIANADMALDGNTITIDTESLANGKYSIIKTADSKAYNFEINKLSDNEFAGTGVNDNWFSKSYFEHWNENAYNYNGYFPLTATSLSTYEDGKTVYATDSKIFHRKDYGSYMFENNELEFTFKDLNYSSMTGNGSYAPLRLFFNAGLNEVTTVGNNGKIISDTGAYILTMYRAGNALKAKIFKWDGSPTVFEGWGTASSTSGTTGEPVNASANVIADEKTLASIAADEDVRIKVTTEKTESGACLIKVYAGKYDDAKQGYVFSNPAIEYTDSSADAKTKGTFYFSTSSSAVQYNIVASHFIKDLRYIQVPVITEGDADYITSEGFTGNEYTVSMNSAGADNAYTLVSYSAADNSIVDKKVITSNGSASVKASSNDRIELIPFNTDSLKGERTIVLANGGTKNSYDKLNGDGTNAFYNTKDGVVNISGIERTIKDLDVVRVKVTSGGNTVYFAEFEPEKYYGNFNYKFTLDQAYSDIKVYVSYGKNEELEEVKVVKDAAAETFASVKMTNENGELLDVSKDKTVKVTYRGGNKYSKDKENQIITAFYDAEGNLISSKINHLTLGFFDADKKAEFTTEIPQNTAKVKVFVWDSFANIKPVIQENTTDENTERTINLYGDSLVTSYGSGSVIHGWGMYFGDQFTDKTTVNNLAHGGWTTNTFRMRDTSYVYNNGGYQNSCYYNVLNNVKLSDYMIMCLGTNDLYVKLNATDDGKYYYFDEDGYKVYYNRNGISWSYDDSLQRYTGSDEKVVPNFTVSTGVASNNYKWVKENDTSTVVDDADIYVYVPGKGKTFINDLDANESLVYSDGLISKYNNVEYRNNLNYYVADMERKGNNVILVSFIGGYTGTTKFALLYNDYMKEMADKYSNCTYIDITAETAEYMKDKEKDTLFPQGDGVHYSPALAEFIAKTVAAKIKAMGLDISYTVK